MAMRVLIDAGHGGRDPGAVAVHGAIEYRESDIAFRFARTLRHHAYLRGHTADYTRNEDEGKPIPLRVAKTLVRRYDAGISLHLNAGGGTGWEIWYRQHEPLAHAIARQIRSTDALKALKERGIKHESLWHKGKRMGILSMRCPVVLIELGFVDNPTDIAILSKREVRIAYAEAILNGIENYLAAAV